MGPTANHATETESPEMTDPTDPAAKRAYRERRGGEDRRKVDNGPPGKHERRRSLEPRRPDVVEREMSDSEWAALNGKLPGSD